VSQHPKQGDGPEGREAFEEDAAGGALAPSAELEEAMREAAAAVEAIEADEREKKAHAGDRPSREAELEAELEALRDQLLRLQADFENFRRRTLREKEEAFQYGHQNLVKDLLPTVDNLDRAIEHSRQAAGVDAEGLRSGVELVLRELVAVLAKHGVAPIEAAGEPFDPSVHEAMAQAADGSVPVNTVIQVFQRGYKLRDRLLRPARVVVSRPPEGDTGG
jgi:molecular chaperone GrpE